MKKFKRQKAPVAGEAFKGKMSREEYIRMKNDKRGSIRLKGGNKKIGRSKLPPP